MNGNNTEKLLTPVDATHQSVLTSLG